MGNVTPEHIFYKVESRPKLILNIFYLLLNISFRSLCHGEINQHFKVERVFDSFETNH